MSEGNNGKLEGKKIGDESEEQLSPLTSMQKKQKLFEENPDRFVCLDDLVLAVKRNTNTDNIETMIGAISRVELEVSLMRITHQAFGIFNAMSFAQQEANKPKIVQSKGSIIDFVRRKK